MMRVSVDRGLWRRLLGVRWIERGSIGLRWGELTNDFGLALRLCHFEDHWSLHVMPIWGSIYLRLWASRTEPAGGMESYGFTYQIGRGWGWGRADIHLNWGARVKIIHLPWGWNWHRTSYLMSNGRTWLHELHQFRVPRDQPIEAASGKDYWMASLMPRWQAISQYRYKLRSGEIQHRIATVTISEMEWRMRALMWLPWPRIIRRTIDVVFNEEIGERSRSFKGGTIGCSYRLRKGETAAQCLARMEAEREL
jgi:hypothetical protein